MSEPKKCVCGETDGGCKLNFEAYVQKMTEKPLGSLTREEWEKVALDLFKIKRSASPQTAHTAFGGPLQVSLMEDKIESLEIVSKKMKAQLAACEKEIADLKQSTNMPPPPPKAARKVFPPIGPRGEGPIARKIAKLEDVGFGLDPENRIEDCEKDIENLKSHVFGYEYTGPFEGDILSTVPSRDAPFSRPKMPPDFLSHRHDMTDSERLTAWRTDFTGNCFHGKQKRRGKKKDKRNKGSWGKCKHGRMICYKCQF